MVELGEGGSALGHVDAVPPLSSSDRVQVLRELVMQVASVFADFRDYAIFVSAYEHPGPGSGVTLYCRGTQNLLATAFLYGCCYCRCMELVFFNWL